ncbi:uncharacterized protein LOC115883569 [Sitophilus oryzae]|uniref:Uncharacterized protein LOC115883569 n=1 Tax=Sitophilus oryzae TaxID=7048 RepID=A0A6J2Y469_SITOR|nr:uncharacterized protein LOC115883569 [Sitophilus oryzae]
MSKFVIILIIGACLVQQNLGGTQLKSSKDEAKKAFHELMDVIDKALTSAQTALDKAVEEVKAEAAELEGKANSELDKVLEPLRTKLNDLVAEATAKGFDVSTCQSYVDGFSNVPDQLVTDLGECITTQVEKAQGYVNDALTSIKKIEEDLNTIDSDIDNCGGNEFKKIKCYAKIIEEIEKDTKDAPAHIAEDVTKATALVTEIVPILEQCFTDKLKKAGDDATKDVADFAICAAL